MAAAIQRIVQLAYGKGGQCNHEERHQIAHTLNLLEDRVRVINPLIGGAFGSREDVSIQIVGIEPAEMKILALKSANPLRADFGPMASVIINVDAPSAINEDPVNIPYQNLREGVRLKGLGPEFKRKQADKIVE